MRRGSLELAWENSGGVQVETNSTFFLLLSYWGVIDRHDGIRGKVRDESHPVVTVHVAPHYILISGDGTTLRSGDIVSLLKLQ